jgi:prepilin-type N-terminal cleavage/methylation domain-containing protein
MKILKNKLGFSLMELMITVAIGGVLSLVIADSFKKSQNLQSDMHRTSEVNNLIFSLTTELSRRAVCEINIPKSTALPTLPATTSLSQIVYKSGTPIITVGAGYGANISNIVSISYGGTASTTNAKLRKVILTVQYQVKQKVATTTTIPARKFEIPINIFVNNSGTVESCYSDGQTLLENAVQYSCQGRGAKFYPSVPNDTVYPYGHCEHEYEVQASTATTNVGVCPAGELLKLIDSSANKMVFKCSKLSTVAPLVQCPAWSYMTGIGSTGQAICTDIRTLFPANGIMYIKINGTAGILSMQTINCPANQILQFIDATGTPQCINPNLTYTCPAGQYVSGIDRLTLPAGQPICSYANNRNACGAGTYMSAIDAAGNVTCTQPIISGICSNIDSVVVGLDSGGNVICGQNQP